MSTSLPGSRHKPLARVFYQSYASADVYDLIRQAAGQRFEMIFLDADDDSERCDKIAGCEAVICAAYPLRKHHLDAATSLKIVHHQGVGWQDTTDWDELKQRGIALALTPQGTSIGVAEHTILMMLAAAKRLTFADAEVRQGRWHVNALRGVSRELFGKTIGYIGMGRIALEVAERLAAFGCAGCYYDPESSINEKDKKRLGLIDGTLEEVLGSADFLTIHVPLKSDTYHLVDARAIGLLKPGAIVVNTARGGIIDEAALADALESGHVLAAGLDVFEHEPLAPDSRLLTLSNVVVSPHISAGTRDAMNQKMNALFENLDKFFSKGELANRVNIP